MKTRPRARVIVEDAGVKIFDIVGDADRTLHKAIKLFKKKYYGDKP